MMDVWKLNLRHLSAVNAITHCGTVSGASAAMNLSQPAITQGIKKLEDTLSTTLFARQSDGMIPTEGAHMLAARVRRFERLIDPRRLTGAQANAFLAVTRGGSYRIASEISGLKEPSLHRAVRDLEVAVGHRLIERRGHSLVVTKRGIDFARRLRLGQKELEAALSELSTLTGNETGKIAIGAMPLSRARILPAALVAFMKAYPAIDVSVAEGSHNELLDPLRDGELDLIVGALREPAPGPEFHQTFMFNDRPAVFGRCGHPLSEALSECDPVALAAYPWVVPDPGVPLRTSWEQIFTKSGLPPPEIKTSSGSVMVIRQILMESDHLTVLSPDQVRVEVEAGWLTPICETPPWFSRTIGITSRTGWHPTPGQSALIEFLHASISPSA